MKKILIFLIILIGMFGIYMLFDSVKNNIEGGGITDIVNDINNATDIAVRQSATNFISALELKIATEYASGDSSNLNSTYTDIESVSIRGTKPEKVELTILMGKVTEGTLEYEKYIVKISDGKVNEMIKK